MTELGSGVGGFVAIGVGILFVMVGVLLGLFNGLILGGPSGFGGDRQLIGIAELETYGLLLVGPVSILAGFFMIRDP